jgi:homoserine dehydrogenase
MLVHWLEEVLAYQASSLSGINYRSPTISLAGYGSVGEVLLIFLTESGTQVTQDCRIMVSTAHQSDRQVKMIGNGVLEQFNPYKGQWL